MIRKLITITLFCLFATQTPAAAVNPAPEFEVHGAVINNLVWRGRQMTEGLAYQFGASAKWMGFGAGLIVMKAIDDDDSTVERRTDLNLFYGIDSGLLAFEVGLNNYAYRHAVAPFGFDVYGRLSADVFLSPTISYYIDPDNISNDWHLELAACHSLNAGSVGALNIEAVVAQNSRGYSYMGASHFKFRVTRPFALIGKLQVEPGLSLDFLTGDSRDQAERNGDGREILTVGIWASIEF